MNRNENNLRKVLPVERMGPLKDMAMEVIKASSRLEGSLAPETAKGTFSLLYFPFDLIDKGEEIVKKEVSEDLEILKEAIPKMLTEYGFSAKTTAGYGIIENEVEFQILSEMERKEKDEKFGFEGSKFEEEMSKMIKSLGEENEQRN